MPPALTQGQIGMVAGALKAPITGPSHVRDLFSRAGRWLEMWGWSAYFEFVHEAASRGVELPPMERLHEEMRDVLERCGYGVLCEEWRRMSIPPKVTIDCRKEGGRERYQRQR